MTKTSTEYDRSGTLARARRVIYINILPQDRTTMCVCGGIIIIVPSPLPSLLHMFRIRNTSGGGACS